MDDPHARRKAGRLHDTDDREVQAESRFTFAINDEGQQWTEHQIDTEQQTQPLPAAVSTKEKSGIPDLDDEIGKHREDRQADPEVNGKRSRFGHAYLPLTSRIDKSSGRTALVIEPMETKSTPVAAIAPIVALVTLPEISSFAWPWLIATA